ncbi:NFACT family protein, partial [bacterium]|nr:NFACT family protein [bacterium]
MNAAEIARIAADLRDIVTGGRLQKIRQPDAHTIVLETRVPGRTVYIIVSARPGLSYVALAEDTPESPPELPAFCALVRKYAQGGGIADVTSVPGDRVARIDAVTSDGKRAIVAELFGRQGDILLLDENDRVLGSLR